MPGIETINPQNPEERRKMLETFRPDAEDTEDKMTDEEMPLEKLEVTSLAEGAAEGQEEIEKGLAKFANWEEKIPHADPEKLKQFIEFCERGERNDPLVQKYPEFRNKYKEIRSQALAQLETTGLHIISQNINKAKKETPQARAEDIETAIRDLDVAIETWQEKAASPKTLLAKKERLQRLISDAREMRDAQMH